ncbi:MAG: hypothetical protein O3A96_05835 [Proteobacteria bacterium]|nr:hypothetical protein [Pseudomonadota bacterium]
MADDQSRSTDSTKPGESPPDRTHTSALHPTSPEAAALAALSLGESLVFLLVEEGLLKKEAVQDALEDAIAAQRQAMASGGPMNHGAAARLLESIMDALEYVDSGE